MSRVVRFCLASMLSLAGGNVFAHAYDYRIDPNATRRSEIRLALTPRSIETAAADRIDAVAKGLPREYASAMTWYRVALAGGYTQAPMVAAPWGYDEQLPEPLHWAWIAGNGDLVTRAGRGVFRLSFADNNSNWFRDVDCHLQSWPGGNTEAPMACNDGRERKMFIPGDGVVFVDDIEFRRVFSSDATALPPEEIVSVDAVVAAAIAGEPLPSGLDLPQKAPVPTPREEPAPVQ